MPNQRDVLTDVFLQPWFLALRTAIAIRNLIPAEHHHKMRFYFEDYGCLKCDKRDVRYGSNAMCKTCVQQVKLKLLFAMKRRYVESKTVESSRTFRRAAEARRLLADLRPRDRL